MADYQNIRTGRHCTFILHAHLVFVTKYRHKVFNDQHVHPLVNLPPKAALSKLVNSLKGVSSRRLRQEFPDLARHYWRAQRLWSGSYFAGSVGGAPLSMVHQYIEQQNRPP
ncbi:IS200/IS605 family transposase [Streptomyces sp. NPDC048340]|uniref:IS200/IS605 family transposase n=1 Tax=Streptomyces sp. NPDC048340 TaxID=3365537 RepID=UPI003723EBD4